MISIPNGHRKLRIPMSIPNLVTLARATLKQDGAYSQLTTGLPKIGNYKNLYLGPRVAVGIEIPMKISMEIPMEIPTGIHMGTHKGNLIPIPISFTWIWEIPYPRQPRNHCIESILKREN